MKNEHPIFCFFMSFITWPVALVLYPFVWVLYRTGVWKYRKGHYWIPPRWMCTLLYYVLAIFIVWPVSFLAGCIVGLFQGAFGLGDFNPYIKRKDK